MTKSRRPRQEPLLPVTHATLGDVRGGMGVKFAPETIKYKPGDNTQIAGDLG